MNNGIINFIKELLDRLQTTNPIFFRWIMIVCAALGFFILADQTFDFVDLGKYESHYTQILIYLGIITGFSWLPNDGKNPKKLIKKTK